MSLLYDLLPQYSKSLDTKEDYGLEGQGSTLYLYLKSVDSEIYEVISKAIGTLFTFSDIDTVEDKYLPYIGYTLGYEWNYYLSTDIQRNLLKNLLDIYKRKGTKFSIHFSLYKLDSNVTMFEPYTSIYTLDRSGLDFNSDSIQLFSKTFRNDIKKIEIDSDDYIYVLSEDIIFKINANLNKLMYKFTDDDNIIDMVIQHNGLQKDYLYYIFKYEKNKYIINTIKLFNIDNDNYEKTSVKIVFNNEEEIEVKGLYIDNKNNLLIITKNRVYSLNSNKELKIMIDLVEDLTEEESENIDFEINKVIVDDDNDIILSHNYVNKIQNVSSHSFLKKYKYTESIDEDNNTVISYDKIFDFVFGYDSNVNGDVTINDIQFDVDNIYCAVNNKYVFKINTDEENNYAEDYQFIASDVCSQLYYNINDISSKGTVETYSELEEITDQKINDTYKVTDENCYYKWLNKWVKIYTTNNKNIVLNKSEYPDNRSLEIKIYDKNQKEFKDFDFNKSLKTITLNNSLSSEDELTVNISEYNTTNAYELTNVKNRTIYLTDESMEKINEYGVLVYFNYNGVNGELLIPEIDFVLNSKEQYIYIKRDNMLYGTKISLFYNKRTSYVNPLNLDEILYKYTAIKLQDDVIIEKVENIIINDSSLAQLIMLCSVVDSISDIPTDGSLYKIKNTNDYYYYNSDLELIHIKYDICLFYSDGTKETYNLVDDENNIDSNYIAYRKIVTEDGDKKYYIKLKRYNEEVLLDDESTFKIKKYYNYNIIATKTINQDYINTTIVLDNEQRPYDVYNKLGFNLEIYINNELLSDKQYTFDKDTNTINFNSALLNQNDTDEVCIDIYNYMHKIYSIGIDNINNISDYITVGFDKCFRVYTKTAEERHSYNTLLPVNSIISKLDNDKIYFIKNKNILDYMYCSFENGGVLTSEDYYSNGILVLKTNCANDILLEAIEYIRPAGWKVIIENSQSLAYNLNSKTYKALDYQKNVTSNEKNTEGYPDDLSEYEYISGLLYKFTAVTPAGSENPYDLYWFEKIYYNDTDYNYVGSTDTSVDSEKTYYSCIEDSSEDGVIGYYKKSDLHRKNYTIRYSDIEPLKPGGDRINVFDKLDNETRYYKEQFLDSIQYCNTNNGPVSSVCMLGQTYDIDNLMQCTDMYLYDAIFDDTIDEETDEITDNITMFRNPIGYVEMN